MAKVHGCPRCGSEFACSSGNWADRHPILTVTTGLFTLTFMGMMFSVYPGAAWTMTVLAAGAAGVRAIARENRRRAALAARADYEHAALMARSSTPPVMRFPADPPPRPPTEASRHVMNRWPTTPMHTVPLERQR